MILAELAPQRQDRGVVGRSFVPAVVAVIVVGAVAVVFAVGLVVLLVVAEQVRQGKAVVDRDMIDAGAGQAMIVVEEVG